MNKIQGVFTRVAQTLTKAARGAQAAIIQGWPVFLLGLFLSSAGLYQAWPPLGLIWPGVVLMGIALFGGGHKA